MQQENSDMKTYITSDPSISLNYPVDQYKKLVEEEIEEYNGIEVTQDLREGGIHAFKGWEYWFKYLGYRVWKTSLLDEVVSYCDGIKDPKILSLGCGYGGYDLHKKN
jgi:hypothetical protein